ncbi:MAG: gluconokinase [Ktedonobacteraceae bacterium]
MPDVKQTYVLALDVGTSSTRALLFDGAGEAVPNIISQSKYTLTTSPQGEVSVAADMLADVVTQTITDVLQSAGDMAEHIAAVALDTFWHSLLGVDDKGRPTTPVIIWEDTRAFAAARELRKEMDEQAAHERTGVRFHASYWPAKLRWLAQNQADVCARTAQWISFGEYLHRKLLGNSVCSLSMASATGMLTWRTRQWDQELMRALNIHVEQLSQLGDMSNSIKGLIPAYSSKWPVLREVPWFPAIGDGAAACIGSNCTNTSNWSLTMGTSSAIRVVIDSERPVVVPLSLWLYFIDAKRAVIGGALSEGGNLLNWLCDTLKLPALKDADSLLEPMEPDAHGLTILPFISGERSPGWHAEARMTVAGLSIHTAPASVLRAGKEAIAYQLGEVHEQLLAALQIENADHKLVASGGALLHSRVLQQIIADTLYVPVYPSLELEASARGAALLALESLGIIPDASNLQPALHEPIVPDEQRNVIYRRAAARQRDLYKRLFDD